MATTHQLSEAVADEPGAPARYRPIGDYGLISDTHSCALVSRDGSIDWCCFPRFDSPSVFARILDADRGGFARVAPQGVTEVSRRYLPETNVLETTFTTPDGEAVLTDLMPIHPSSPPESPRHVRNRSQVVRLLRCTHGHVRVDAGCWPRFDYGDVSPSVEVLGEHVGVARGGAQALAVWCSAPLGQAEGGFEMHVDLAEGDEFGLALTYLPPEDGDDIEPLSLEEVHRRLDETVSFWERWSAHLTYRGKYRDLVLRSALTVKALSYSPSGALLAAATTSLPESVGGWRNWDYRFSWIRDASLAVRELFPIGFEHEIAAFMQWLKRTTEGRADELQVLYGITGERRLTESELPSLEGYRESSPVRVGNAAYDQFQLDIYGELVNAAQLDRSFGREETTHRYWAFLKDIADVVVERRHEPDAGIWEQRGEPRHFVYSRVMCWVALDRAIRLAEELGDGSDELQRWRGARAAIYDEVFDRGVDHEHNVFRQAYEDGHLDASLLVLPLVGFVPVDHPTMRNTIEAIERELAAPNGLIYRYRNFDDGVGGPEGTFTVCTCWLIADLALMGEQERAEALFERVQDAANDLGLLSEEIDANTGEQLGNFPQAFSHLGLIKAAVRLDPAGTSLDIGRKTPNR